MLSPMFMSLTVTASKLTPLLPTVEMVEPFRLKHFSMLVSARLSVSLLRMLMPAPVLREREFLIVSFDI